MAHMQTPAPTTSQATRARMYHTWALWGYETMAVIGVLAIVLTIVTPALWSTIELPAVALFALVVIVSGVCRLRSQQLSQPTQP